MEAIGKRVWLSLILAAAFLLIGVATLDDYGVNWDEPVHFMRGQAYWRLLTTGKRNYNDLPKLAFHFPKNDRYSTEVTPDFKDDTSFRRSYYQSDVWNGAWFLANDSPHPPLNDILAAATNWFFYQKLGVLGDVEAYHLFEVFCGAIMVFLVTFWVAAQAGLVAGLVAGLALFAYPLFLGETRFNIKDPVEACFFSFTIFSFWLAVKKSSPQWLALTAIFAGMALATKPNIAFVPLVLLPWFVTCRPWPKLTKKFYLAMLLMPVIVGVIFFVSWPYLWQDPLATLAETWGYYRHIGTAQQYQPARFYWHGFNTYPLQTIFLTTPLLTLLLAVIGVFAAFSNWKKDQSKTAFLWLLWLLVPVGRVTVPGTAIYGGVRQIMEYLPALALLAGLGAHFLSRQAKIRRGWLWVLMLAAFAPITLKLINLHPSESLYFNELAGGLRGAAAQDFPDWGLSLGNEYRQGVNWLNENAASGADLNLARGLLSNLPRIWIRPDINFGDHYFSGEAKKGEYVMGLIYQGWDGWIPEKAAYLKTLPSVFEYQVDGVTVLKIWHNKEPNG